MSRRSSVLAGVRSSSGKVLQPFLFSKMASSLAVMGDSRSAQWLADSSTYDFRNADGMITWALGLSDQRLTPIFSAARGNSRISGESTAPGVPFGAQAKDCIASGARHIITMGGVNDALAGIAASVIIAAYDRAIDDMLGAGRTVWACTDPPINKANVSWSAAAVGTMFAVNDWLRMRMGSRWAKDGLQVVDVAEAVVNTANADGDWKANGTWDNLHQRNIGAYYGGKAIAAAWKASLPAVPLLVSSRADAYATNANSRILLDNGLFVAGSGTATNFTGSAIAGGNATNSLVAAANGIGNAQRMVQTSAASNDGYRLQCAAVTGNGLVAGDIVELLCRVKCSSMTNFRGPTLQLVANGDVGKGSYDGYVDTANDGNLPEDFEITMRTPWVQIEGAPSSVYGRLDTSFSGAGGATVDVSQWTVRKLVP